MGQKLALQRIFNEGREAFSGQIEFNQALSKYAYYQIGGAAAVVVHPKSLDDLKWVAKKIQEARCPFFVLGWGSNLLFPDEGFYGVVLRMKFFQTQAEVAEPGVLELGASLGASSLLRKASEQGWGGLEFWTGIPGSVGGMVAMNAGTHLGETAGSIFKVETFDLDQPEADPVIRVCQSGDFSYRKNHFLKPSEVVIRAWVRFTPTEPALVKQQIDALYLRRKETQPVDYPSCGSVFMNPEAPAPKAWQVVDQLGLRGHRIGQAQISEKHPNFIVNLGGAQASEVKALIQLVQARALSELGIQLHTEVKIL